MLARPGSIYILGLGFKARPYTSLTRSLGNVLSHGGYLAKMNLMKMVVTMVYMSEKQRLVFGS